MYPRTFKTIVLYGCDNSGKTTAANNIKTILTSKGFSCDVIHSCGPLSGKEQLEFMIENLRYHTFDPRVKVFDRFPAIEEYIYGPIVRGKNKLGNYKVTCNELLKKIDLFIYCNPSKEVVTNWGKRPQMEGVKENAEQIMDGYETITKVFPVIAENMVTYDWTAGGEKKLVEILLKKEFIK